MFYLESVCGKSLNRHLKDPVVELKHLKLKTKLKEQFKRVLVTDYNQGVNVFSVFVSRFDHITVTSHFQTFVNKALLDAKLA